MCSSWRSDPCQPMMEPAINVLILPAVKTQFAQNEKRRPSTATSTLWSNIQWPSLMPSPITSPSESTHRVATTSSRPRMASRNRSWKPSSRPPFTTTVEPLTDKVDAPPSAGGMAASNGSTGAGWKSCVGARPNAPGPAAGAPKIGQPHPQQGATHRRSSRILRTDARMREGFVGLGSRLQRLVPW